jgi:Zn2+/Cd2+-exporting ATPase
MQEQTHALDDPTCLEVIDAAIADEPGIVNVELDTAGEMVAFDYDPRRATPADVERVAQSLAPTLVGRWSACTMRLDRQSGRACESCALALERQLQQIPGVRRARASYLGGVLSVHYDDQMLSPGDLVRRVRELGITVAPSAATPISAAPPPEAALSPLAQSWRRLRDNLELVFTLITLITMIGGWLAGRVETAPALLAPLLFVIAYITGGAFGLKSSLHSLRARTIDIDLLMILAALGAAVVGEPFEGAMLLFLFSLSNVLQDYALGRTRSAIRALMQLRPNQAVVRRGERTLTLPIEQITVGDRLLVKPGERIALDGVVVEGQGSVDQSSITGESLPVNKEAGDTVFAGTINQNGHLEIGVTRLAKDSTIARLIQMVEEAHSEKAETQRFIDTAEQYYAMGVIAFTALAIFLPPLLFQEAFNAAFYRAMTIMVAASPCALVISTPATVLSAIGNGARRGILFKGGIHVENAATVKVVAFDKTGTLTVGEPQVTDVFACARWESTEDELLALAAAVEMKSEHPLAQAVVKAAQARGLELDSAANFQAVTGMGVQALVNGRTIHIGNLRYFTDIHHVGLEDAAEIVERLQNEGKTSVIVAQTDAAGQPAVMLGVIALADVVRASAADVVRALKAQGVRRVVMLTGDNQVVAQRIAAEVGVDEVYAELMPEDKVRVVKELGATYGPVAMVGDGVNDAPALASATIGIAMGAAGTDVALETADVVLMSDDLHNIPYVMGLSRKTRRTLLVNLGFALAMIVIMLVAIFVSDLPLPLAVIGHEGGTVLVSLNGLRMLAYRP